MEQSQRHYSLEEYFGIEEMSEIRHEYLGGEIFAMAGGSRNHNEIALNLRNALHEIVRHRACRSFVSDVRLKTPGGLYTYPDVMVVCGDARLTGDRLETVTNPVLLAEVLSTSTRDYDQGQKFDLYRSIPTLRDYLLVDQYAVGVEHRFPAGDEWRSEKHLHRTDQIRLKGVPVTVPLATIYESIEL